ncbi:MAG: N,N'-diacetyllegionaminic acid synthase [Elusimicrobia bacterium]|nr:N,N'-diacetyllegionaminic acid synthase [Elusimicrobiota bacterium]
MEKIIVIAEAGINHGGDVKVAHEMIDVAKDCGADVVKFQTVNPDLVYAKDDELYGIFDKVKLQRLDWLALKDHAEAVGIEFLSTPGEVESADMLDSIGVEGFKIASDSAKDIDFVAYVMGKKKPVIVSMGQMKDIDEILATIKKYPRPPEIVLHCVSKYPLDPGDAALYKIPQLKEKVKDMGITVGYSDHTEGITTAVSAVMLGAKVLEKHFMLSKKAIDAPVSLMPDELKELVNKIRSLNDSSSSESV